jgi:hypothetical protein
LKSKIEKNDLVRVLHRSVLRSAADGSHCNEIVLLFGKIVTINVNQEILVMICQTELGIRQITQTSMLAVELGVRCTA